MATPQPKARDLGDAGDAEGHRVDRHKCTTSAVRLDSEAVQDPLHTPGRIDEARRSRQESDSRQRRLTQPALTRVTLTSIAERLRVYLRFGKPIVRRRINARCHGAFFAQGSVFCRIWWEGNEYGTTAWQLSILQAETPRKAVQRVIGVAPGATVLLHVRSKQNIQRMTEVIHSIEAQQIDPSDVAPDYWRMVQNRLAARAELGSFCADRHSAALLRRSIE